MSRKRQDPGVAALQFFKEAPLPVAEFVLAQATVEVKARQPQTPKPPRKRKALETPAAE